MKNFLITGVAGFIGSHVAKRILKENHKVIGIDDLSSGKLENIPKGVDFINIDLSNPEEVKKIHFSDYYLLHLAGQSSGEISFDSPVEDLRKNTISTLNLINHGIENKAKRFIFASSMSVYGETNLSQVNESHPALPLSCYGVGKLASEHYLRIFQKKIPYISMRMFNVYGEGQDMVNLRQGMVSIFISQAMKSKSIQVKGSLERYRDFIYIDDVVNCWLNACLIDEKHLNQSINIGTGIKTTVKELLDIICKLIPETTYHVKGNTPGDQLGICANNNLMREYLYQNSLTSIYSGIEKFIDYSIKNTSQ